MKKMKFEIGKKYFGVDDPESVFIMTVVARHRSSISYTLENHSGVSRTKTHYDERDIERFYVQFESKTLFDSIDKIASSNEFLVDGVLLKIGQRVEMETTFFHTLLYGKIILFNAAGITAVIELDKTSDRDNQYFRISTRELAWWANNAKSKPHIKDAINIGEI